MARLSPRIVRRVEDIGNPFWISYADLMTALVMLFLVVMSISMVAIATRPLVEKKERETDIQAVFSQLEQAADREGLELEVDRVTRTIRFGERARFALNSYYLSSVARENLRAFVPLLLELYNGEKGRRWLKQIHIEGYTDATGTYLYNVNLSLNRAQAVVCALFSAELPVEKRILLRQLLIIDGASVTGIKASADASRRVEVRLAFRQPGDETVSRPPVDMPMGRCAIDMDQATPADLARERAWEKEREELRKREEVLRLEKEARQREAAMEAAHQPEAVTTEEGASPAIRVGDPGFSWIGGLEPPLEQIREQIQGLPTD